MWLLERLRDNKWKPSNAVILTTIRFMISEMDGPAISSLPLPHAEIQTHRVYVPFLTEKTGT